MSELVKKRPCSNYTDQQITEALHVLALCSGNARRAAEELKERGMPIPHTTLYHWKGDYAEELARIEEKELPRIYGEIARRCEDLALDQADAEQQLLGHLRVSMGELKAGEVATALRNVAVSKAVNIDKASLVRGRPTVITERRDATELVRALAGRFGGFFNGVGTENTAVDPRGADSDGEHAPELHA